MNVKTNTRNYYNERINTVLQYINKHLNEELDIEKLALLGAYIVRLRLETAVSLLMYSGEAVSNIAFNVGYENPSSFNKAFKKRFGISPAELRKSNKKEIKLIDSKVKFNAMENLKSLQPKVKKLKSKKVIYARSLGSYNQSAEKAWGIVCDFAKEKKLFGFNTEFIGISHDDPKITESNKLRYDACIAITKEILPEGEIGVQDISGGSYAVFTHKGAYENLNNSYDYIFGKWLPDSGKELRNNPCFEKYLNAPDKTKPEKLLTEIYVPLQ